MSEQTEHPPSSPQTPDPWAHLENFVKASPQWACDDLGVWWSRPSVDAARRQVEAQHQETVKKLTRQRDLARFDAAAQLDGYMEVRAELATLRAQLTEAQEWADIVTRGQSPCGHWKAYCYTEDGIGRKVDCWQCRTERAEAEITRLKGATS